MRNKILITLAALVAVAIFLGMISLLRDSSGQGDQYKIPGKIRIKDYEKSKNAPCAALMPGCGYCPGEVIGEYCYLTQAQFDDYKNEYSELEAYN